MEIDEHVGCAMSGLIADARTLVEHARVETQVLFLFLYSSVTFYYLSVYLSVCSFSEP
jgi:20S proteasome alpha/beta subunit